MAEQKFSTGQLVGFIVLWFVTLIVLVVTSGLMIVYGFPAMSLWPKVISLTVAVVTIQIAAEKFRKYCDMLVRASKKQNIR